MTKQLLHNLITVMTLLLIFLLGVYTEYHNPARISQMQKEPQHNGQSLTQELLNSLMRNPGEPRSAAPTLLKCPRCGEHYCGNGVALCTECATTKSTK